MAKRVRGSRSTHRPGGQGPSRTRQSDGSYSDVDASYAPMSDIDAAIESVEADYLEVAIAEGTSEGTPVAGKPRRVRRSAKADDLSARMAAENVYVRDDLWRIVVVSVILLIGLAVATVLFLFMDVLDLY